MGGWIDDEAAAGRGHPRQAVRRREREDGGLNERILVVDDDPVVREVARGALEREGYVVYEAVEGGAGLDLAAARAPGLVVLDRMLPDVAGEIVLRELRRRSQVPILVLSAMGDLDDRVEGLGLGADDYLPKPFSPRELVARVKALLRRSAGSPPERDLLVFDGGSLAIDTVRHEVRVGGAVRDLTRTEYDLLCVL